MWQEDANPCVRRIPLSKKNFRPDTILFFQTVHPQSIPIISQRRAHAGHPIHPRAAAYIHDPAAPGIVLGWFVYSYIIVGETITLIDTGVAGCERAIFDTIRSAGRDPAEIALIILTHSHPGHIGAAKSIRDAPGCSIAAHPAERGWIEDIELQNRERPVPEFATRVGGPVQLDHKLIEGDGIEPDDMRAVDLQVVHTPGHPVDSISLWMASEGALFSIDAIPVAVDLPLYDDAVASARSLERLRGITGIRILLSAWDDPREMRDAYRQINRWAKYLQRIHITVRHCARTDYTDRMELMQKTAAAPGILQQAVHPLLARTFAANLRVRDREYLRN